MGHRVQGAPDSTSQCERARDSTNQSSPPRMQRAVQKGRRFASERGVERNENTSISSGVTDTNAISPECNQGTFDGGATYRLELQCYHLAGKSERKKKQQQPQQQQQGIINVVQCKGGHPFVDPTEGPTRPLVYMKGKTPSEYYLLRSETLQDIAMNAMFNNYGCGHDDLPPPLQRMYHNHIYIITITNKK